MPVQEQNSTDNPTLTSIHFFLSDSCTRELQRSETWAENKFVLVAVLVDKEKL